ncbi:uncharacterized protein BXZ73DRAFT_108790 [Epithele typhae]|uniref:uncharacterized protein n=1 Tax=Epithele typhae TaxID=378194 RepID=UPI002008C990|nr:uncharacterized protein BXZ73DRAFT_108790 [Epithele typhae]KAH9910585.1 hypothetical protein BXZ73DRAFT_108790 [Epithele typhae]
MPSLVKRFPLMDAPVPQAPHPAVVVKASATLSPPPLEPSTAPNGPQSTAEALERRASKCFSTYNISKMTGDTIRDLAALLEDDKTTTRPRTEKGTRLQRWNRAPTIEEGEGPPPVPPLPGAPFPLDGPRATGCCIH